MHNNRSYEGSYQEGPGGGGVDWSWGAGQDHAGGHLDHCLPLRLFV